MSINTPGCWSEAHSKLVRPAGFEPATPCLGGRCSIQLSYGRLHNETVVGGEFYQTLLGRWRINQDRARASATRPEILRRHLTQKCDSVVFETRVLRPVIACTGL